MFESWDPWFAGLELVKVDLQAGLDVATASMEDYATAVVDLAGGENDRVALCGWSMGGLVALQAARAIDPEFVVVLEPSPPAEVQGFDPSVEPAEGTFDPEVVYGPFPAGMAARPESVLARDERKRGISVPRLPCRSLVVYGEDFPDERGRRVAALYGSEELELPGLDHWQLVLDARVPRAVAEFVAS